jgi:periplasmic copper chaperone A
MENTLNQDRTGIMNRPQAKRIYVAFFALAAAGAAQAHIVLEQPTAPSGSYYKATLRVTHGCNGSATKAIQVTLPEGFRGARPMPKAGWMVDAPKIKLAQPYQSHGKTIAEDVAVITWSGGPLLDAHYDEFAVMGKLPEQEGTLYFKVLQTCEQGQNDWSAIPQPGKTPKDYPTPAAALQVIKPQNQAGEHKH